MAGKRPARRRHTGNKPGATGGKAGKIAASKAAAAAAAKDAAASARPAAPEITKANSKDTPTVAVIAMELQVCPHSILDFLLEQGFDEITNHTELEAELIEIITDHKDELEFQDPSEVHLKTPFIVKVIADTIGEKPHVLVQELMGMKVFASVNQTIDKAKCEALLASRDLKLVVDKKDRSREKKIAEEEAAPENIKVEENPEDRKPRSPVVAVMGHVDHGKTSLLDALRKSSITSGEAGGITQHTGASVVERNGMSVTFLDTPGHAAFSAMRKRGADLTDICILLVAADDGINEQTKEALKHIQEAKKPMLIVINKMDLPNANADQVMTQLQQFGILTEEWGGEVGCCKVSAKTGEGLDALIERIHLEAEINEVSGNPKLPPRGIVIEAEIEQGMGATASILVQDGTIKVGDTIICGQFYGKVKALIDGSGKRVKSAGPATPVKVLGLNGAPDVGAILARCKNEKEARSFAEDREAKLRKLKLNRPKITSMEQLMEQVESDAKKVLRLMIKTDVRGTGEAIKTELEKIESDKINLEIISNEVGAITNNDVVIAASAGATILGFHVRTNPGVNKAATKDGVDIQLYSIIYELIDTMREKMTGMLDKVRREIPVGKAEIMQVFFVKAGKICGSAVRSGKVKTNSQARVIRDGEVIYNGEVKNLKRFKDDVKEVPTGMECGILLNNFNDFEVGDIVDVYQYEEIADKL